MKSEIVPVPKVESKSWSEAFVDRAKQELADAPPVSAAVYVRETASTAVEYTEAGVTGSMLGAAHARFGLDSPMGPADGWLAAFGAIFGVVASGHFPLLAARARGVGSKAFTVLAFRRAYELVKHEPLLGGSPGVQRITVGRAPGVPREDPIEVAARQLDG